VIVLAHRFPRKTDHPLDELPGLAALDRCLRGCAKDEERKVRYLGALYASVVFEPSVSPASANSFLRIVDSMSYGELVCLALITDERYRESLSQLKRLQRRYGHTHFGRLIQVELAGIETDQGAVVSPQASYGGYDPMRLDLGQVRPTGLGAELSRLMGLDRMPESELRQFLDDELAFARLRLGG
jgi:hypothetical protein